MDTFTIIKDNLIRNYVLYFPSIAISKLKKTVFEGIIPEEAVNIIVFFDENMKSSTDIKDFSILKLIGKKDILDSNLFQLFEAKKSLDGYHFRFLLNKYRTHIEAHLYVTEWMYKNINKVFKGTEIEEIIINLFKLQAEYFENHNNELNTHFKIQTHKLIYKKEQVLKHFEDAYSIDDFKLIVPKFDNSIPVYKKSKSIKKHKEMVSDEHIDRFLLTTVFNVDL